MKKRVYKKQTKKYCSFVYFRSWEDIKISERDFMRLFNDKSLHNFTFKHHEHKKLKIRYWNQLCHAA